jgi:adenine deaminase
MKANNELVTEVIDELNDQISQSGVLYEGMMCAILSLRIINHSRIYDQGVFMTH